MKSNMYQPIQLQNMATLRNSVNWPHLRLDFLLITLALAWFGLSGTAAAAPSTNTSLGTQALQNNTTGTNDTGLGYQALKSNTAGGGNTATGSQALLANTTGVNNTATGFDPLISNTTGQSNTANGWQALYSNTTGSSNIAIGVNAGFNLTTGSNNIDIGNAGVAAEANTIRIGSAQTATFIAGISGVTVASPLPVVINASGRLGTASAGSLQGPT